jgi:dTDP-4-dehydrorhamnose 3,5-epimerase
MHIEKTAIEGLVIIHPTLFKDDRGYFFESFNEQKFASLYGQTIHFVQDNQARSSRNVLRGLHYQLAPYSPTYGQHVSIRLSSENKKQFFVPRGFAHGYVVLSDTAEFFYKCDNYYNKEAEGGLSYNDPALQIDWMIDLSKAIISDKDLVNPILKEAKNNFTI